MIITRTAEFYLLEDQLIVCKMLEGKEVDAADVKENFEAAVRLAKGERYTIMADGRATFTMTKEGLESCADRELYKNLIANALVVNSIANRLLGNFIINFHKPPAPTKLFSNTESALSWLRKCILREKRRKNKRLKSKESVEVSPD